MKWPSRDKEVFTDLSSTSSSNDSSESDSGSSSERGSPSLRSTRLLRKRLAQKAAQLAASAVAASVTAPARGSGVSDERARRANARRRAKAAAPKSGSEDNDDEQEVEAVKPSRSHKRRSSGARTVSITTRKTTTTTTVTVKAREKTTTTEPPNKKRKVSSTAGTSSTITSATVTRPVRRMVRAYIPSATTERARNARAMARDLVRENPELDLDEIKLAAAAGVMRSGRARGSNAAADKMPVTGPPITVLTKRKRAVTVSSDGVDDEPNEEEGEDVEQSIYMRRGTKITPKSESPAKSTIKSATTAKSAGTTATRKGRASEPGPLTPSTKAKIEFRTRGGSRWGAPSSDSDQNGEDDGPRSSLKSNGDDVTSPSLRPPLLSLPPNPAFFALRKRAISDPAAPPRAADSDSSRSATRTQTDIINISSDDASAPMTDALDDSDDAASARIVQEQLEEDVIMGMDLDIDIDISVDKTETELTLAMDGASSDLSQSSSTPMSVPSLEYSSVPSSSSSVSVQTPQPTHLLGIGSRVAIRDATPTSTASSTYSVPASRGTNVRTYQSSLWKRSHVGVSVKAAAETAPSPSP